MEKLKAGVYCRVSTTKDAQEESIEQQQINGMRACSEKNFEFVDIYKEKKTATEAEKRTEYQRMISDIKCGRIKVIVVKDLIRLNRNNMDWSILIDTVKKNRAFIYFYMEKRFYSKDRAMEDNIRQMMAAYSSEDLSAKSNFAHRERQESGRSPIFTNNTWGYKTIYDENGKKKLVVDEEEAEMIRLIFQYYLQGYGSSRIAKKLYTMGYKNHNGKMFNGNVIIAIIKNPKVTGTIIMNKKHFDFDTKKRDKIDESEWIIKDNVVPPIIDKETWEKANEILNGRSEKNWRTGKTGEVISLGRYEGKSILSKKLYCGLCGAKYYVNSRKTANEKVYDWICSTARKHNRKTINEFKEGSCKQDNYTGDGCDNIRLKESDIVEILDNIAKEYFDFGKEDNILEKALGILREVFIEGDGTQRILKEKEKWDKQLAVLVNREKQASYKLLDGVMKDDIYQQLMTEIAREKAEIQNRLEVLSSKVKEVSNIEDRLIEIEKALKEGLLTQATSYSVLEWSEKLLVYPDRLDIVLDMEKLLGSSLNEGIRGQDKVISVSLEKYKMRYCESGMKKTNEEILKIITENPKVTQKQLAEKVGLSEVTICSRLKAMKEKGILYCYGKGKGKIWKVLNLEKENSITN